MLEVENFQGQGSTRCAYDQLVSTNLASQQRSSAKGVPVRKRLYGGLSEALLMWQSGVLLSRLSLLAAVR